MDSQTISSEEDEDYLSGKEELTIQIPERNEFSFQQNKVISDSAIASTSQQNDNRNLDVRDDLASDLTKMILKEAKARQDEPETFEIRPETEIHKMHSNELLTCNYSPFTNELELPEFEHGSAALQYYQILRTNLSKYVRSSLQYEHLKECLRRKQMSDSNVFLPPTQFYLFLSVPSILELSLLLLQT